MVTTLDGRETEIEIVAIEAQKIRWEIDKEFLNFEGLIKHRNFCRGSQEICPNKENRGKRGDHLGREREPV
jgi:hypothetical protein